jgi:outer membrane protein assembly factor BamB
VLWRYHTQSLVEVSNWVAPDGTIVLGTNADREYGIRPDGHRAWSYDKGEFTYSSSVVRPDGLAYFGDNQGRLTALRASDGHELVRLQGDRPPCTASIWTAPAVDAVGDAYVATQTGWIYGFGPDGRQLFALNVGAAVNSYPAIGADGAVYFGTVRGVLVPITEAPG